MTRDSNKKAILIVRDANEDAESLFMYIVYVNLVVLIV